MTAVSLNDSSITSSTPGVLVKGEIDPELFSNGNLGVVAGNVAARRISDTIDSAYIDDAATAYFTGMFLQDSGQMLLYTSTTNTELGTGSGPQFTLTGLANLWVVLFYGSTSAAWEGAELDNSDTTEPYVFTSASVTAAGPTNNSTLRNAINADSTVTVMLIDGNHPAIDTTNLTYDDEIISLADSTVTSSSAGVLVKGTVDPAVVGGHTQVVWGSRSDGRMSTAIDSEYIFDGNTGYWTRLQFLSTGVVQFYMNTNANFNGSHASIQLTEDAEDNIWILLWYSGTFAAWEFAELDLADETNPYSFSSAIWRLAGPQNNAALRTALNEGDVIAMLVDGSSANIDTDNWTWSEQVINLRLGANTPDKLYLGANEVDAIYLGANQVY